MTEQTQPTDAELEAAWTDATGSSILPYPGEMLAFARAAIAKWGTPAGAGVPVGYINLGMAPHTKGKVVFHEKPTENIELRWWTPDQPVFATPQPTQAQAGAVPTCYQSGSLMTTPDGGMTAHIHFEGTEGVDEWFDAITERLSAGIKGADHG